jgi:SAM-dependent methyltransferase
MAEEFKSCYACGLIAAKRLTEKNGYFILRCGQCGHGWVKNLPDSKALDHFYAESLEARSQYSFPEAVIRKHAEKHLRSVEQVKKSSGIWLDVGCGPGFFLEAVRNHGWQAVGLEMSSEARRITASKNIPVYESLLSVEEVFPKSSFEVVSLWETVEHLTDPRSFLQKIKKHMKKGCVLALSTPNFQSALARKNYASWQELRPPLHLHYFTPKSLRILLEPMGFKILKISTYGDWHPWIEDLPVTRILKTGFYKTLKIYFKYKIQRPLKGLGLLGLAALETENRSNFREIATLNARNQD